MESLAGVAEQGPNYRYNHSHVFKFYSIAFNSGYRSSFNRTFVSMIWLTGILAFVTGLIVGAVVYKQLKSDEARVKSLEEQLEALELEHESYKDNVHSHFNNTANLLNNLTDSYRDVYRHMAAGAQSLCPEYISEQLTHSAKEQESLTRDTFAETPEEPPAPPRDYAAKSSPDQKGSLSEDYGLDKVDVSPESIPRITD